jgi:hypothetical protein
MERRAGVADCPEVLAGGPGVGRLPARTQRERELSFGGKLLHCVVEVIGAIHRVVGANRDPVRTDKEVLAPRAHESALSIEDDDGMIASIEDEDPVARVGRDAGNFNQTPPFG